ncbi:hypothetical protein [Cupriavidus necator]
MQKKYLFLAVAAASAIVAACGGSGSDSNAAAVNDDGSAATGAAPAANDSLDASCLAVPAVGQKTTITLTAGPIVNVATFDAKAIGKTTFDGGSYDTLEIKLASGTYEWAGTNSRLYIDPASPIFPIGAADLNGDFQNKYNKYRRFTYTDTVSGQVGTPNLVGMKANETRSFLMKEAQAYALATAPQPPLAEISRTVRINVSYIGREDVTARGVTYKGACKLAIYYERQDDAWAYPVLEGKAWLAPGAGIVKLSGAPLAGVDTMEAEGSGIVAIN